MHTIRTWDLPTRLFHWTLVVCVVALIVTGNIGGDVMALHFLLGYCVLTLVLFRFFWGLLGGYWSRFSHFPIGLKSINTYLRGQWPATHLGHNPVGSYSVIAILSVLLLQAMTGLISDDEIANQGPLTSLVSGEWVSVATSWHTQLGKLFVLVLSLIHVLAIVIYKLKKGVALVPPMIHGNKTLDQPAPASADGWRERLWAMALLAWSSALVWSLIHIADAA